MQALSSLIFLKENNSGEIKSRTCINGAPQRAYIKEMTQLHDMDTFFPRDPKSLTRE